MKILQTNDGGFFIAAQKYTTGPHDDIYIIKIDSSGNSGCNENTIVTTAFYQPISITIPNTVVSLPATTVYSANPVISSGASLTTLCSTTSISEALISSELIQVYPNPFTDQLSITFQKQNVKYASVTIKNILGQIVFSKEKNDNNNTYTKTIDLSEHSKGIYLLDLNIDGERTMKKLVKE